MDIKGRALALSEAIANAHNAAAAAGDTTVMQAVDAVHEQARILLYRDGAAAGLTKADIAQIDNHGTAITGGEPKADPQGMEA